MPSVHSILAAAHGALLDVEALLLPSACLGCARALRAVDEEQALCTACRAQLRPIAPPVCRRCGQPRDPWDRTVERGGVAGGVSGGATGERAARAQGDCAFCRRWPEALAWAASAVWLDHGPARRLVHALKYGGWRLAAGPMAVRMARECAGALRDVDVLVPVPLGRVRRRERGHNQAEALATALGARMGVEVAADALVRSRETMTQTALAPAARQRNVQGAFGTGERPLVGRRVAIVDDVLTTGATLGAAAEALASSGAAMIGAVTFGRALVPS
jgi:ComF family protein